MKNETGKKFFGAVLAALALSACGQGGGGIELPGDLASANATVASSTENQSGGSAFPGQTREACELSVLDEQMLELLNAARSLGRYCGADYFEPAPTVSWSCTLEGAAAAHSEDMGQNNFFSHTGSDGLRVGARADAAGYAWQMVGENIAVGFNSAEATMQGWLNSPSHCRTVMNPNYQETAFSLYLTEDADYYSYWTLLMAKALN